MKFLLSLALILSLASFFMAFENPNRRGDLIIKLFQFHFNQNSTENQLVRTRRDNSKDGQQKGSFPRPSQGRLENFCSMFNCPCYIPPSARCCEGYLYDERSKECRYVY
ncbi:hypothetical protein NPIL_88841 [Nephila pilipes]|uniref:Spider venom protein n=1 Tax=Nephila pilipes TaxID=299642 RepID=A0A8X6TAW0_NEPPI|nr:hypothetical protein NPIL_88841 [Nephila pilipes]